MAKSASLADYRAKRDFAETPEPSGREPAPSGPAPRFVIQKHAASTLHYDFRLEVDGVLKSWAVRKGPSTNPADKRLAQPVEDHPLAYADFEGVIPSGYGAGAVIVWDRGTYRNLREDEGLSMAQALEDGKVVIWLEGEKLRGAYTLLQMKGRDGWLLIKRDDAHADPERDVTEDAPASVLTGRTVESLGGPVRPKAPAKKPRPAKPRAEAPKTPRKAPARRKDEPSTMVKVGPHEVELTNLDRVLFPNRGLTKGDLVDYYRRVAERMVPLVAGRPLLLQRFPEGIDAPGFVQQHVPEHYPDFVTRATVEKEGGTVIHAVCDNAATLVFLANQGVITPHVWLSRTDDLHHPDRLIFDLDPSNDDFEPVRGAAHAVRELLEELGLPAFVMTTGSSGLHVVVPLDLSADFDTVRSFARDASKVLVRRHGDLVTDEQRKAKRGGRVFLDVMRNTYAHTAVPPYAVRAKPGAPVATPLSWDELDDPDLHARRYTLETLFERLASIEDPWAKLEEQAANLD
ncbi:MAG TPA: non-homologous end-joining DNA ligase, partial [Rhodothermales bacterium]|nr:non-homologous end-joining DNA ligase [Rhodothermales bacterium]